jgi:alpha-1,6-mannosyltransferase
MVRQNPGLPSVESKPVIVLLFYVMPRARLQWGSAMLPARKESGDQSKRTMHRSYESMFSTPPRALVTQFDYQKRTGRSALLFGCLACIVMADGLFSAFVLPQAPGRIAEPSADLIAALPFWSFVVSLPLPIPRQSSWLAIELLVASALKFAAYGTAIYLAWNQPCSRRLQFVVISAALLFFLVTVFALPNVNRDIYNYILSGRVAAVYGSNPYYVAPDQFPNDLFYRYASARYTSYPGDNKLPMWMLLNIALAWLGGDKPVATLLLYRVVFLLFNLANLALVAHILYRVQPRQLLTGLVLYAWNPIVIAYGQSKVDTIMVFFLLLAALALVQEKRKLVVIALGISALVKLITLPLIAVYWLYTLRARIPRELALNSFLLGLTAVALYAPFWYGPELLSMQVNLLGNVADAGPSLVRKLLYAGFMFGVLWVGLRRDGHVENMLAGWVLVMILFALLVTKLGFSWYLMTMIAAASLAVERRFVPIVIILSCASFFLNAWDSASNEIVRMPMLFPAQRLHMQLLFVCVCVLGLAVLEIGRRARQRHVEYSIEQR